MAQANKRKARKKPAGKQKSPGNSRLRAEILLLLVLALSLLLLLGNFGLAGVVGQVFSNFFFGLFGLPAYLFPILLFLTCAFFISNGKNALVIRKTVGAGGVFLFACAFMQLLTVGYEKGVGWLDYFKDSSYDRLGGGLVGGLLVKLLGGAFGSAGAYVLIIISLIIFAIIMTQKPLLSALREESTKVYHSAKDRRRVSLQKRKERKNSNRKSSGMSSGGKLLPEDLSTEENQQLVLPLEEMEGGREEINAGKKRKKQTKSETFSENSPRDHSENPPSPREAIGEKVQDIQNEIADQSALPRAGKDGSSYCFPPLSLLKKPSGKDSGDSRGHLRETAAKLQQTLHNFGVNVTVTDVSCGPTVTRYEIQPEQGVKVSRIVSLTDDIKLNLAAEDIRIEAPIPGKAAVGIEVPNKTNSAVMLRELLESQEFIRHPSNLAFAVGKDIGGKPVVTDIAKMPHLLIAGATGSGKSVCINTLIISLLYKATPEEVKLIMIDPKVVELSVYNGIPHLYIPVVTDPKKAAGALHWAVSEMTDRYNKFAEFNVRDLEGYNSRIQEMTGVEEEKKPQKLPQIVIIVDELADLMMVAPGEVEDAICRLAQLARAAGIHLIIATQRPSVNVITGLIKANMPSRIALSVTSGVDSRTILDMNGAEKLLGKGDMLFYPQNYQKPARVQGAFVSDDEIVKIVEFLSSQQADSAYDPSLEEKMNLSSSSGASSPGTEEQDSYFNDAARFIIEKDKASIGMLQRAFKIGFNRAARIMDQLYEAGVVGEEEGTKPRKILMTMEQFENYLEGNEP